MKVRNGHQLNLTMVIFVGCCVISLVDPDLADYCILSLYIIIKLPRWRFQISPSPFSCIHDKKISILRISNCTFLFPWLYNESVPCISNWCLVQWFLVGHSMIFILHCLLITVCCVWLVIPVIWTCSQAVYFGPFPCKSGSNSVNVTKNKHETQKLH
jgi:hypothetical protein